MFNWLIKSPEHILKYRYFVLTHANDSHFHENAKVKKIVEKKNPEEKEKKKNLRQHLFILIKKKTRKKSNN